MTSFDTEYKCSDSLRCPVSLIRLEMFRVVSIILLLSCVINIRIVVARNSSILHEIVDETGTFTSLLHRAAVETTVSINDNGEAQATIVKPKHAKPKLCNGHLGKQECSFRPHSRSSSSQSPSNLTQETVLFDLFNLSMVLCSAVMLPTSYLLFISLQK